MPRDLTFQALKLLAQYIVSNETKIPEGRIFLKTSCMNPDDAQTIGVIEGAKLFLDPTKDKAIIDDLNLAEQFMEYLGISRWMKGELTHLGFRAGTRYEEKINVADDSVIEVIDEAAINAASSQAPS